MKYYISLGGSSHDFATFVLNEKGEAFGIEDERISQVRYALESETPCEDSFQHCLDQLGIEQTEIKEVYANDMLDNIIKPQKFPPIHYLNHHLTHAYSTFFTSPFEKAAILVADGTGSHIDPESDDGNRETISYYIGDKNEVKLLQRVAGIPVNRPNKKYSNRNNSLGSFYDLITELAGFGFLRNGKTMGLAPYGETGESKAVSDKLMRKVTSLVKVPADGNVLINLRDEKKLNEFIRYAYNLKKEVNDEFVFSAGMAHMGQRVFEKNLFHCLNHLYDLTGVENLCLAGGVMLNSMANGKIKENTKFKNVHVIFAPGDSGTAIGGAIWPYINDKIKEDNQNAHRVLLQPYLGFQYNTTSILNAIKASNLSYKKSDDINADTAQLLQQGSIVGWFQNRSEFGPRALGNRSILATPTCGKIRDKINEIIKQRELFRPFAPVVVEEDANKYFKCSGDSTWMQFVFPVREAYHQILQGITHVNGSARVQVLKKKNNPGFYKLLEAFEDLSGVPVLLNTSFNIQGQPIVETPEQAIRAFKAVPMDYLVINNFIISKNELT